MVENEHDLQEMIDCLHAWCEKWIPLHRYHNTNTVHFRNRRKPRTDILAVAV